MHPKSHCKLISISFAKLSEVGLECLSFRHQAGAAAELEGGWWWRGGLLTLCFALRGGAPNFVLSFTLQLQPPPRVSVLLLSGGLGFYCRGNRFSSCIFSAGCYYPVVAVWNSVWGTWTFSLHFFLFPFLSFEFSFLKRCLFLNSSVKGRRFHFLWEMTRTGVCLILALSTFSSPPAPHCLEAGPVVWI